VVFRGQNVLVTRWSIRNSSRRPVDDQSVSKQQGRDGGRATGLGAVENPHPRPYPIHQDFLIYWTMATATLRQSTDLAPVFRALGDPTRLRLLAMLRDGERCVCELTDELRAAQSRLSFHLKTLRDAGLIQSRKEGRWMFYSINSDQLESLAVVLGDLRTPLRTRPDVVPRLCQ